MNTPATEVDIISNSIFVNKELNWIELNWISLAEASFQYSGSCPGETSPVFAISGIIVFPSTFIDSSHSPEEAQRPRNPLSSQLDGRWVSSLIRTSTPTSDKSVTLKRNSNTAHQAFLTRHKDMHGGKREICWYKMPANRPTFKTVRLV